MQEIWVLTVKTSLPGTCYNSVDWKTTSRAFDSFEKGRDALREAVKEFAFSENSMFDGKGNIRYFQEYVDNAYEDDDEEECIGFLDKKLLTKVADDLREAFAGKDVEFALPCEHSDDDMLAVKAVGDAMYIRGFGDGPINGYTPDISTNIFSIQEKKHYFLYINDRFSQYDNSSELYIDLQKAKLN